MHHISLRQGLETVFSQPPAHRLARQALVPGELDHERRIDVEEFVTICRAIGANPAKLLRTLLKI
jgi:hypothetical protein